ncbi:MAG: cyclic nucleotide-binding domain-containing protein [Deltaproteobacteria bacterium]|nr:cyclic nucleotide-binding domain-containing protein [Deltaproteobacteria bacterium]
MDTPCSSESQDTLNKSGDRKDLIGIVQKIPFFSAFDRTILTEILRLSKTRKYQAGERIIVEGTYDSRLHIMINGTVAVTKQDEIITLLDEPGDVFGELAIIDGDIRSASVKAVRDTICLEVDASFIDRLKPAEKATFHRLFYSFIIGTLARRLRITTQNVSDVKLDNSNLNQERNKLENENRELKKENARLKDEAALLRKENISRATVINKERR